MTSFDRVRRTNNTSTGVQGSADAKSTVVGVDPVNLPEMQGVWGICVDGDDETTIPGSQRQALIRIFVLSRFDEYSSKIDIKSKEVSVP